MRRVCAIRLWVAILLSFGMGLAAPAYAHVGSKDVFEQIDAGPYRLFVTIRTPTVIPGVATLEVRSSGASVDAIRVTPIPLTGEASKNPLASDAMRRSADDPAFFTGSLWLMASGSWQVRLQVEGAAGPATAGVPVPAMPLSILPMQRSLGITLAVLGLILTLGMVGIVAAAVREARLAPGVAPTPSRQRRALIASGIALAVLAFLLYGGNRWWNVEAAAYAKDIYHPLDLHATLTGNALDLAIGDYNEKKHRWSTDSLDEFLLDHGHLMHLYAIRQPGMDAAFHLHPAAISDEHLGMTLPAMPPGDYKLYADVVRLNGFPETLTATLDIPPFLPPTPLAPDDASAFPSPLRLVIAPESPSLITPVAQQVLQGDLGPAYKLPDGYTMVWDRPASIAANTAYAFRFTLLDGAGHPAVDMQPYLGMAGHAAFVKDDGTTFAHTHPEGSAAMPAVMLANPGASDMADMPGMAEAISPTVEFPYGFPSAGRYRIFIQMKHGGTVETGVFDAEVR
jgi:hypothetical protein